jgi:hypothetical protein
MKIATNGAVPQLSYYERYNTPIFTLGDFVTISSTGGDMFKTQPNLQTPSPKLPTAIVAAPPLKNVQPETVQAAISNSNRMAVYTSKIGDLPIDASPPSLREGGVLYLDSKFWKVDFLSTELRTKPGFTTLDFMVISQPDGKDSQTLTYWTDFERIVQIPLDKDGASLSMNAWLSPALTQIGTSETLWPQNFNLVVNEIAVTLGDCVAAKHKWPPPKAGQLNLSRLECIGTKEYKYWSGWLESKNGRYVVCHHYGAIGATGSQGDYAGTHSTLKDAEQMLDKKINEKLKKGYHFVLKGKGR